MSDLSVPDVFEITNHTEVNYLVKDSTRRGGFSEIPDTLASIS
jgi:hypothetical protein